MAILSMADKKISASYVYDRKTRVGLSVYAFDNSPGRVDVRVDSVAGIGCGFALPAAQARELAAALLEQAEAAEAHEATA